MQDLGRSEPEPGGVCGNGAHSNGNLGDGVSAGSASVGLRAPHSAVRKAEVLESWLLRRDKGTALRRSQAELEAVSC